MSPPGRPKGECRRAQPEGAPVSPPGRSKGEYRRAQPNGDPVNRRTVAWFLAAHVGAASALLGIAASVGGGWAGPVMPPVQVASVLPQAMPAVGRTTAPSAAVDRRTEAPSSPDLLPPWQVDADGRVHWRSE